MPAALDAKDRNLIIGAAAIALLLSGLAYAIAPPRNQQQAGFPSSYSAASDGSKAAYLFLQRLGYGVERWESAPDQLPSALAARQKTVLILASPFPIYADADRAALRRFVSNGGEILAVGFSASDLVPGVVAQPDYGAQPDLESRQFPALLPSRLTAGAASISMRTPDKWVSHKPNALELYGTDDHPVVTTIKVGAGEIIWWASPWPLTNAGIREQQNAMLLLNSIGPPGDRHLLWDEYFHGMRESFFSYVVTTPLPWAALQVAIAFLLIAFTFSRRSGPIRAPLAESRLSPLEFIETLGDLYQTAHAAPVAVAVSYQRYRTLLLRKLGLSKRATLQDLSKAAAPRIEVSESALLDTSARAERAMRSMDLDEKEALALVQELHDYSNRLDPPRREEQEPKPKWK
jgi:hypothetical protein